MSAFRIDSAALKASLGSTVSAIRTSGELQDGGPRILLRGILEKLEELRNRRQNTIPVGNQRHSEGILDELGGGLPKAFREGRHGDLLAVPVELEAVQHRVRVIAGDRVLSEPDVPYFQAAEVVGGEHDA